MSTKERSNSPSPGSVPTHPNSSLLDRPLGAPVSSSEMRELALDAALSGANLTPSSIMKACGFPETDRTRVAALVGDPGFLRAVFRARERVEEHAITWAKARGLRYIKKMDEMVESEDSRVAFAATKDLLDRIGTAPTQKVALGTLDQYRALIEGLQSGDGGKNGDATNESLLPSIVSPKAVSSGDG